MTTQVTEYARLPQHVYAALERECATIAVTQVTTELQAGFQLGVQDVLKRLRNGYVVPSPPGKG